MTELLYQEVPIDEAYETPLNNRRTFNAAALAELTESVRTKGILTPLVMRRQPKGDDPNKRFEILAGARRNRAALAAGLLVLPARIGDFTDGEALEIVVIENLQREDLHPLEEAEGYRDLLNLPGYDVAAIAAKVHKSESYVHQRIKLTELIDAARDAFLAGRILLGHALLIARLQPADQAKAFKAVFRDGWNEEDNKYGKRLVSVRELAREIESEVLRDLKKAVFDTTDTELVPAAGACTVCPKRTGTTPSLFPDIDRGDICTDGTCYAGKVAAHIDAKSMALTKDGTPPLRLSSSYGKPPKGVLGPKSWKRVKPKECLAAVKGIIAVEGGGEKFGTVLTVCADRACSVHWPREAAPSGAGGRPGSADRYAAQRQRDAATRALRVEIHRRIFTAIGAAVPTKLGRPELERLAFSFIEMVAPEDASLLAAVMKVDAPAKGWSEKQLREQLVALPDPALVRLLAVFPLLEDVDGYYSVRDFKSTKLSAAAIQYGIDVAGIEAAVAAEAKQRLAEVNAVAKAKAGKGKAKKAKASKPAAATRTQQGQGDVDEEEGQAESGLTTPRSACAPPAVVERTPVAPMWMVRVGATGAAVASGLSEERPHGEKHATIG